MPLMMCRWKRTKVKIIGSDDVQRQAQRHGVELGAVDDDQRPEEVLPRVHEGEDSGRGERGPRERQDDLPVDLELGRSVDPRRVEQLVRDREHVLPQEEDPERAHGAGEDEPVVRVEPPVAALAPDVVAAEERHVLDHQVRRDERDLAGDHHRGEEEDEDRVPARELALGEGVGRERVEEELEERDREGDECAVQEPASDELGGAGVGLVEPDAEKQLVVVQRGIVGDPVGRPGED
jgi:hypothetical protein